MNTIDINLNHTEEFDADGVIIYLNINNKALNTEMLQLAIKNEVNKLEKISSKFSCSFSSTNTSFSPIYEKNKIVSYSSYSTYIFKLKLDEKVYQIKKEILENFSNDSINIKPVLLDKKTYENKVIKDAFELAKQKAQYICEINKVTFLNTLSSVSIDIYSESNNSPVFLRAKVDNNQDNSLEHLEKQRISVNLKVSYNFKN